MLKCNLEKRPMQVQKHSGDIWNENDCVDEELVKRKMETRYYEGCGREGPIRCIFLGEFHPVAGPKISCQVNFFILINVAMFLVRTNLPCG